VKKATVGFVLNLGVSLLLTGTTNENLWNSREISAFRLNRRILVIVINEPDSPLIRCLKQRFLCSKSERWLELKKVLNITFWQKFTCCITLIGGGGKGGDGRKVN